MKQKELIKKINKAHAKAQHYAEAFEKSDNPQIKALYFEKKGEALAFQSVIDAINNNPVDLDILGE